jgi:hypothetical protein
MPGPVPGIHVLMASMEMWMAGTLPSHDEQEIKN